MRYQKLTFDANITLTQASHYAVHRGQDWCPGIGCLALDG